MMNIIPKPRTCKETEGTFCFDGKIQSAFDLPLIQDYLADKAAVVIEKDDTVAEEGYRLSVKPSGIQIHASGKTGAYYALQTLRRLSNYDLGGREVPCCEIEDAPRFRWRGLHLDESRHFFGMAFVKKMLDRMFAEKLNVFHWHLTDDHGWRIEIKQYPRLTEIGSRRGYSQVNGWGSTEIEYKPVQGFYTQEQIKEIVAYARERGIMVVPEIDFPAHCAAAMAAYPELACFPKETEVPGYFGGTYPTEILKDNRWNRTVCCGKDTTFTFIFGVLDEVCALFDAPYIHVGGDEAPMGEWERCPACQRVIKENGLQTEQELQGWFENQIIAYLKKKEKNVIGWNEIINCPNLNHENHSVVIQYWTPDRDKNAEAYVNQGGSMILSNHQAFYFDMPYAQYPLTNTYQYEPEAFGVNQENVKNVLGVEGELWTEWIADTERLEMMAFPRVQALAEVAWSPADKRDFADFKARLDALKPALEQQKINYAEDAIALPEDATYREEVRKKFECGDTEMETRLNREYKEKTHEV